MNLLFTVNKDYLEHVTDCIKSIIRFKSKDGYDIYILHSDLSDSDQYYLSEQVEDEDVSIYFKYVDSELFEAFPETDRYPRLIYYRIFAAWFLPKELDRILYLDSDTITINPLDELYEMDFNGNYFLACTHVRKLLNKVNQHRLGMEEESTYINSGVMLMNLDALRRRQDIDEVLSYMEKRKRYFTLPDQDIITAMYGNRIGIIDTMKYNLSDKILSLYNLDLTHEKIDLDWIRENTVIIHYYGKNKPWNKSYQGKLDVFYKELKDLDKAGVI
jgi:lipopolysaccharide biosynthesis glycosyltransferase